MEVDQEVMNLDPLPPITERLKGLRPSKELLEFYRQKLTEFDAEHNEMLARLDKYKQASEKKGKLRWELAQREQEVTELQKALSDLQVYLFQEREHVLRLYAENDRLKLQEVEDRKKIRKLLAMSQPLENETTYFHNPQHGPNPIVPKAQATQKVIDMSARRKKEIQKQQQENEDAVKLSEEERIQSLLLTIEALKAQLADQSRLAKEETAALLEDRRVREEEFRVKAERDAKQIQDLTEKVQDLQDLLYDSTRDFLELKYNHRQHLREGEEEKERLLRRIEELKDDIDTYQQEAVQALQSRLKSFPLATASPEREYRDMGTNAYRPGGRPDLPHGDPNVHFGGHQTAGNHGKPGDDIYDRKYSRAARAYAASETSSDTGTVTTAKTTESEYGQQKETMKETLADMYREQCIQLEDELCRLKEEREASKRFESKKVRGQQKRAQMWKERYQQLERRRALEVEGYKRDIAALRKQIKETEKKMYKLVLQGQPDASHEEMLRDIKLTTVKTSKMVGELQHLKGKVYSMERGLKTM